MRKLVVTDVRVIPGDSAFLIDDGKTAILYDTGFAFTGVKLAENVKKVLGERTLDYIFLTHSHYDHALGSCYVKKVYPNAKVVAGEYAEQIFKKPSAKKLMRELDNKFAHTLGVESYLDLIDDLAVDVSVKDGDEIIAGDMRFIAVYLPGHTKCSFGFYMPENKLLLSCETIGVYWGQNTVIPSYLVGYQITLDSIARVEKMDIENIFIPHYGLLEKKETQKYLKLCKKSAKETAREVAELFKAQKTDEEIFQFFKNKFYFGQITEFYPKDAFELNTRITIALLKREIAL